jgi:hypothetical protein
MLQQLLSRLQPKAKRVLAFRLARELDDCGKDIMAVFGVSDFDRDYEDTWEWIQGENAERLHVNISRPHNWKTGDYTVPVLVRVHGPASRLTDDLFSGYASRLASVLRTEVWFGTVTPGKNERHYDFEIEQRFTPAA